LFLIAKLLIYNSLWEILKIPLSHLTIFPLYGMLWLEVIKMKNKRELIKEEFKKLDTKQIDSKYRINLGKKIIKYITSNFDVDSFEILIGKAGDILLRPVVNIPAREQWVYKKHDILKQIEKGLEEAKQDKTKKIKDLDKYIDNL